MNTLQNFFKRSLGFRSGSPLGDQNHHHHICKLKIELDKDEFKSNDKITGKLLIQAYDSNIRDIGKICLKFYDELDIQWEEYMSNTLYNTSQYKTFKRPLKINDELILDPENAIAIKENDNNITEFHILKHQKFYHFYLPFEFELPKFIHSTVTMPNASYAYYIEAFFVSNNEYIVDKHGKTGSNNNCFYKTDLNIFNSILKPNELSLNPLLSQSQITEMQTPSFQISVTIPKGVFFSKETIQIKIDIEELAIAFNVATSTIKTTTDTKSHHHHIKLNKIVFKLYQYCKIFAEEPEKKSKVFDYLIKQTTRKIIEKCDSPKISLTEDFQLPDQLFSSTDHYIFDEFNRSNLYSPKKLQTLSYLCDEKNDLQTFENISLETTSKDENFNEKFFYGICVDYKLVVEVWKSFMHQDTIIVPLKIDPEQY